MRILVKAFAILRGLILKLRTLSRGIPVCYHALPTIRGFGSRVKIGHGVRIYGPASFIVNSENKNESIVIGNNVTIEQGTYLNAHGGSILIEDGVHLGVNSIIQGKGVVTIRRNSILGPHVHVYSSNHTRAGQQAGPWDRLDEIPKQTTVGENVWICAGAIILPGSTVRDNALVNAGAVFKG